MTLSAYMTIVVILLSLFHNCKTVTKGEDWKIANEQCRSQNDSLVDIQDIHNKLSYFNEFPPIWSTLKKHFTPWIAYKGCYNGSVCESLRDGNFFRKTCHLIQNNTVGNCYFECKIKNFSNGGCANYANFFFGLQNSICLCLCDNTEIRYMSESAKCNIACDSSINNGECGGIGYFSVYASMNVPLTDNRFGEFCLTCHLEKESNKTVLNIMDCNEIATGYCVMSNGNLSQIRSSFDSYWRHCRRSNMYIVGSTGRICHLRECNTWTGLRKYKIYHSNINNKRCYMIEFHQLTITVKDRNCSEKHFFLCKGDIGQRQTSGAEYIKSTKITLPPTVAYEIIPTTKKMFSTNRTYSPLPDHLTSWENYTSYQATRQISHSIITMSSKSQENKGTIVSAIIAGVVLLSVFFLVMCLLKRRRFQCMQSNQQQSRNAQVFNNTTYDDMVVTNQKPDAIYANNTLENNTQGNICEIDDIYVEKEEEYDHLHSSRQKKSTTQADEEKYGSASYFEDDSYSSLRQNRNVDHDLNDEYSVKNMPFSENQSNSMNSAEYAYCYQANQKKDW